MQIAITVNTINFLFSKLMSICENIIWCLAQAGRGTNIMRFDIPSGSKLPHLQVRVFESLQIQSVCRRPIDLFCSLIFIQSVTEIPLCEVNVNFPGCFTAINLAKKSYSMYKGNYWHETSGKCGCISVTDKVKINEQNK